MIEAIKPLALTSMSAGQLRRLEAVGIEVARACDMAIEAEEVWPGVNLAELGEQAERMALACRARLDALPAEPADPAGCHIGRTRTHSAEAVAVFAEIAADLTAAGEVTTPHQVQVAVEEYPGRFVRRVTGRTALAGGRL